MFLDFGENFIYYAVLALGILIVLLGGYCYYLERKISSFFVGEAKKHLDDLRGFERETLLNLANLDKKVRRAIQSADIIRFSPFKGGGVGGNQSFAASILNESGDGMVLSGLYYSRDRVSIFAKPVKKFTSDLELSPEENEAIEKSKKQLLTTS